MKSLCVEGCRNINHSYSLVNQWQLLYLVNYKFKLFHNDMKPPSEYWNSIQNSGGLNLDQMEIINKIPTSNTNKNFDVVYRINFPLDISESNADRLFVFGSSEYGTTKDFFVGASLKDACHRDNLNIITPSNWSKIGFLKAGFKENKIRVIPHGIEPSAFYKSDYINRSFTRKTLNIKSDDFLLLNIGSLTLNKGVDFLLAAYISLKPKYSNLKLLIKDSSNLYGRKLKNVVDLMNKDERFKHLDFSKLEDVLTISKNLNVEQMNRIYNSSDAYVSPYLAEGFNLPPLEAAACGVPIIVSSGGSTDDYFSNKLGLQISSKRVLDKDDDSIRIVPELDSLIDCIETLINSNKYGGKGGSRYVHDSFNWKKITNLLVESFSSTHN